MASKLSPLKEDKYEGIPLADVTDKENILLGQKRLRSKAEADALTEFMP